MYVGPFLLKTMTTIEDKNIPTRKGQHLIQVTICDYDEENDEKETRPVFKCGRPLKKKNYPQCMHAYAFNKKRFEVISPPIDRAFGTFAVHRHSKTPSSFPICDTKHFLSTEQIC